MVKVLKGPRLDIHKGPRGWGPEPCISGQTLPSYLGVCKGLCFQKGDTNWQLDFAVNSNVSEGTLPNGRQPAIVGEENVALYVHPGKGVGVNGLDGRVPLRSKSDSIVGTAVVMPTVNVTCNNHATLGAV